MDPRGSLMVKTKPARRDQCSLTEDEYKSITLELGRIDYLAHMGSKECEDPRAVECATSLIQERTDITEELLSRAFERARKEKVANV